MERCSKQHRLPIAVIVSTGDHIGGQGFLVKDMSGKDLCIGNPGSDSSMPDQIEMKSSL